MNTPGIRHFVALRWLLPCLSGMVAWWTAGCCLGQAPGLVSQIKVLPDKAPDCSSLKSIVATVTRDCKTNDEKAVAIYNFMQLTHYHRAYPGNMSALQEINSYGWSLCGGLHSVQSALWRELGWDWRFVGWQGHTTVEAQYDGRWHYLDVFLKFYAWMPDPHAPGGRTIAGEDDLNDNADTLVRDAFVLDPARKCVYAKNNQFVRSGDKVNWQAPSFLSCGDELEGVIGGLKTHHRAGRAEGWGGIEHATGSYSADVNLAPGFLLDNFWNPIEGDWYWPGSKIAPAHTCGGHKDTRNYPGIGFVLEPYVPEKPARSYASGGLTFSPDFSNDAFLRSFVSMDNVKYYNKSLVPAESGKPAAVVAELASPYVMVEAVVHKATGADLLEASIDGGKTFKVIDRQDLSRTARGRMAVQVRFTFKKALTALTLVTVVQNNPGSLPFLSPGRNVVTVSVADPKALGNNRLVVSYAYSLGSRSKSFEQLYDEDKEIAKAHNATWGFPVCVQKTFTAKDLPATFTIDCPTPKGRYPVYPRMVFLRREVLAPGQSPAPTYPYPITEPVVNADEELATLPNPWLIGTPPPPSRLALRERARVRAVDATGDGSLPSPPAPLPSTGEGRQNPSLPALLPEGEGRHEDPYLRYVRTASEFRPVKQDPKMMIGRWDTWVYMPWRYQWTIGTGDEGGQFCRNYGFNGGFTDHGEGPLAWLEKWQLRFYNDHTADKGYLYLRGANSKGNFTKYQRNPRAVRSGADGPQPLDDVLLEKLRGIVTRNVNNLKQNPQRVAYALDDEVSWGAFILPLPWRVNADDAAYEKWLRSYYGASSPRLPGEGQGVRVPRPQYVTPDFTLAQLNRPLGQLDFSPLLDRLTYNDSVWANFLGKLVESANQADPDTPCGFVGGQCPNIWGGYDYAKLMKKIQFIEAYNIGSSQAIIRSFNPQNSLPQVTTHFHSPQRGTANDVWQSWYYFAHGNRGMIGWVEGWFDGNRPQPWLAKYRPTLQELGRVQGPKMAGARWVHDGVAIYYSHPSIQVSWCLDSQPHGKTWVNRGSDDRLGTSHNVRRAWEYLLTDSGIQYDFLSYDRVVVEGVPDEYKVLILPACYAISDIEARRIREFHQRGGTVIADFAAGLFDQHGKGRTRGALDDLFGVRHDGRETSRDFFAGRLWVETDQDAGFSYKKYAQLFATLKCPLDRGFAVAERRLPVGGTSGPRAVYLNLSPQRYLQFREEGTASDAQRSVFLGPVTAAGVKPWVTVTSGGKRPEKCEVTYWSKNGRTLVFVVQNAAVTGSSQGGGGAEGLGSRTIPIKIELAGDVQDVVNERTGDAIPNGRRFSFEFKTAEAVFFSFRGGPPRN